MSFKGSGSGYARSSLASGTQLNGTYEIGDLISSGGMGEVYRGHNIATGDPVAIKVVLPEYAADTLILELFRKEARILYQLAHDAIVRYYGFASDRDLNRSYMAMEFVEGPSLAARLNQGPLPVADVVGLKTRLADGLQRAHELGIIHRDISPENVILQGGHVSRAKIIDFGIAKSSALAGEGTLIGTTFAGRYNYASPEQVGMFRPQTVSPRSDIYSLGLVLAAALRGTPIDMSGTMAEIMEKRLSVPDLSDVPEEMRGLLTAMLEPNPEDRAASMADVRDWPVVGHDGQPIQPRRAPPPPMPLAPDPSLQPAPRIASRRPPPLKPSSKTPPKLTSNRTVRSGAKEPSNRAGLWIGIGIVAVMLAGAGGGWYYVKSKFPPQPEPSAATANTQGGSTIATPKAPDTSGSQQAAGGKTVTQLGSDTAANPDAGGSAGAGSDVAQGGADAGSATPPATTDNAAGSDAGTGGAAATGTDPQPTAPPNQPTAPPTAQASLETPVQMSEYIAGYDGGPCFFAWPRELRTGEAKISVFAFDKVAFEGFYEAFKAASGFDPVVNVHKISQLQCAAVDAIKQLVRSKVPVPVLTLAQTKIPSGGVLMGEMKDIIPGKKLEILHVDDRGQTFRLTGLANGGGTFTARIGEPGEVQPGSDPLPQLAIVLSSPKSLQSIAKLDDRASAPASTVFPALMSEAEASGRVSVAVQFFVVTAP